MNSQALLTRLQNASPEGPLDRLAALVVEHELSQSLETLLPPALLARALKSALEGWLASPTAEGELASLVDDLQERLAPDPPPPRATPPRQPPPAPTHPAPPPH